MKLRYLFALIGTNMVFMFVGGLVYHLIESPHEEEAIRNSKKNYARLLSDLSGNISCLDSNELDVIIRKAVGLYDDGEILVSDDENWDMPGSIFFASTVITTIGYGHISLQTDAGRRFTVFYALVGIPLCLIMLGEIGIRFSHLGQHMDRRLNRGWFPRAGKYFRPVLISVLGVVLFILIPALIMCFVEDWDYGTAVYYGFITLTTVGFGDVVAGRDSSKNYRWVYHISLSFWIMLGLAWVANLIANSQELYRDVGEELIESDDDESDDVTRDPATADLNGHIHRGDAEAPESTKEHLPLVENAFSTPNHGAIK